jgi:hypothetical protein
VITVELTLHRTHNADAEWRATFAGHPLFAPVGHGAAPTPWQAVQRAAWAVVGHRREERGS